METRLLKIRAENGVFSEKEEETLKLAGEILKAGGLVAFPTETVYGLGGDALNPDSARRIYAAKGRPSDNPLIIHICRLEDIHQIVKEFSAQAQKIAETFWPGPLTMILPKADRVPYETTGGLDTVAVRFPAHPVAQKLIACGGGYIAAPSANTSGKPSPTIAKYVEEDMRGRIEAIIDGGEVGIGLESTIIDLTVAPPQILRPGYITREKLAGILGIVEEDVTLMTADSGQTPKAPGMKYRHYAPQGELTIVQGDPARVAQYINRCTEAAAARGVLTGVIAASETAQDYHADVVKSAGERADEEHIARKLYTFLREFDDEKVEEIYSESFESEGFGQAIMNRLLKAAGYRVVRLDRESEEK